jgi:cytoplasmic iron level regulating protein YaaA (DUF328/UPF0246 family)
MLVVLSPSKTLDYDSKPQTDKRTQPDILDDSSELIEILREYDVDGLRDLMGISEKLAVLNVERYDTFETPFTPDNAKPAITAFTGDVYRDFRLDEYDADDFDFLQAHTRILSGLYGLLRPLDLMQPYRLEMGTRLENPRGKKLYDFWGHKITDAVNAALDAQGDDILLNLASNEYFDSIDTGALDGRVLNVNFKDLRDSGEYKTITFYLKRLRGTMTDWMVRHRVSDPEGLKGFDERNYYFSEERSTDDDYVFLRDEKP